MQWYFLLWNKWVFPGPCQESDGEWKEPFSCFKMWCVLSFCCITSFSVFEGKDYWLWNSWPSGRFWLQWPIVNMIAINITRVTNRKMLESVQLQSHVHSGDWPLGWKNALAPKLSSKVEWTGMLYSCLYAFIHWHHRGAGLKNFIHPCHVSFGSSMQAAQCIQAKIKHARSFYLTVWLCNHLESKQLVSRQIN